MAKANDPRFKNELPEADTLGVYLLNYSKSLHDAVSKVSEDKLQAAFDLLTRTLEKGKRIYVAGNGGSSAIADHLCCDWMKGTAVAGVPSLKVHSLTSNSALFTALANDFGYENSLAQQIEYLGETDDVVVLISSSGNSINIVKAAEVARAKKMSVIGLSGFSGGALAKLSDVNLHVPANNYGIAEDAHQMLMHVLGQFLAKKRDGLSR